ncbi:MAG TPA: alpha/beta hydrolase [Chitinophagaceae bacterium]|nr:alpha/beta hydrolase [Chitinophagaceae bacterium]
MILLVAILFLIDFLSLGFLFLAYYMWKQWYLYDNTTANAYADRCLYGFIALMLFVFLGKFLIRLLISKRRNGEDEPKMYSNKNDKLKRPDGTVINIEYFGKENGQPIIFVHGWNSMIQGWYYQIKHFENNYRIICIDLPGLGKSIRPGNKDFSLSKMAQDLNAVIAFTKAKDPILWGHSIGGMIILTLLAKHKETLASPVKGIILQHTTYTNPVKTMILDKLLTAIQKPVLVPICYLLIYLSPLVWLNRWLSYFNGSSLLFTRLLMFTGTQTPKQLDFVTLLSTMAPPAVTARGVLGMFEYDVTNELPSIDTPAYIIAANKDRLTKPEASIYMRDHLPKAQLITVMPGGHQGLVERHKEVNDGAEKFIHSL